MLKALLHRKLGRATAPLDEERGRDAEEAASDGLTECEDPLTATVFERLAYLPPDIAWDILRRASKPLGDGPAMPTTVPEGAQTWSFWPSLRPGERGLNKQRVEPDVLVLWSDTLLLIEAKHRGFQDPAQWIEQIRAVRAAHAYAGKSIWILAAGGTGLHDGDDHLAHVRRELQPDHPGLLMMRWEDLREVLDSFEVSRLPAGASAILADVALALTTWGYRRKTWLSSLPAVMSRPRSEKAMSVLQAWRVRWAKGSQR